MLLNVKRVLGAVLLAFAVAWPPVMHGSSLTIAAFATSREAEERAPNATGRSARFNGPAGVATDSSGNIYVADKDNSTIRKITSAGMVTTLAGLAGSTGTSDGRGSAARFNHPAGVATDSSGNVYVADSGNSTIRKITPSGTVTTLAGVAGQFMSADGTGSAARFNSPEGVATDSSGNIYVADTQNHTIRKITPQGTVTTLAGRGGALGRSVDGVGSAARFYFPKGVATDGSGNIYVAENQTIRKITAAGVVTTLAGLAGKAGRVDGMGSAARFYYPEGVATDSSGNIYVCDWGPGVIRMITAAGTVTTLAGGALRLGSADGAGRAARFFAPSGVAIDGRGNLYVADSGNSTIRKITPAGIVTTLAGLAGSRGSVDGTAARRP